MIPVHVTYRAKPGLEEVLEALLHRHAARLRERGLISEAPVRHYRDAREPGVYVEMFEWKDIDAIDRAHAPGELGELWEHIESAAESVEPRHLVPLAPRD